jgi:hypothetical protein
VAQPIEEAFGGGPKFHRTGHDDHAPVVAQQHTRFAALDAAECSRATATSTATDNGGSQQFTQQ